MKIGIISDTHKKVEKAAAALDMLVEQGAEFIIHAGDIVEVDTLELLKQTGKEYVAVYGNNDAHLVPQHNKYNLVQEPHYFDLAETKFKLMHLPFYMSPDTEVIVFGHTHKFELEFINGTLFLNPGESCARNNGVSECVLLEITEDKLLVQYYSKKQDQDEFKEHKFSFQRMKDE